MNLQSKKVTVIGMGKSGVASSNFLAEKGADVTLIDCKPRNLIPGEFFESLSAKVTTKFETSIPSTNSELIILSPGVDIQSPHLAQARKQKTPIWGEIELACRFTNIPIVGITGTNGKSTCASLINEILNQTGNKSLLGGNIGVPFISLLEQQPADFLVLEISSFQLETIHNFHPQIGIILNITPDHLDRHQSMDRYAELKGKIASNQNENDFLILNHDDPFCRRLGAAKQGKIVYFSRQNKVAEGAFLDGKTLWVRWKKSNSKICELGELKQAMQWQVENVLAASIVATILGVPPESLAKALKKFPGLEHRLEWVRTFRGVDFINDSKGTNIGAVKKSLATFDRPIILIAGGKDKDSDFSLLKSDFKQKVKHMVLLGEAKTKIQRILNGSFGYDLVESLEDAVRTAVSKANPGDVILLSPACSSFDMFKNYIDRGTQFRNIVQQL